MRTTLNVDKDLLNAAVKCGDAKTPSDVVNRALAEFVRRRKVDELRRLIKTTTLDDTWQEDEEAELRETQEPR
jgi:Arc/MetJ family transcription regulator